LSQRSNTSLPCCLLPHLSNIFLVPHQHIYLSFNISFLALSLASFRARVPVQTHISRVHDSWVYSSASYSQCRNRRRGQKIPDLRCFRRIPHNSVSSQQIDMKPG
jgi:hypothetical protein